MKSILFSCLIFIFTLPSVFAQISPVDITPIKKPLLPITLTLMSYNIHHGEGLDGSLDIPRIGEIIMEQSPDVVLLQEVDRKTRRVGRRDTLRELEQQTGLLRKFSKTIDFEGGRYGIGLLSKQKPTQVTKLALPDEKEPRTLLLTEFDHYFVANTHLPLNTEDRIEALKTIINLAEEKQQITNKPFFLGGDFNFTPLSPEFELLTEHFILLSDPTIATYPADMPKVTIDYICLYKNPKNHPTVTLKKTTTLEEPIASDHRPIVVKILIEIK